MEPKYLAAVIVTFVVALIGLTFALTPLFDSTAIAIGPAIAISIGIAGAVYFAFRDKGPSNREP